MNIDTRRPAPRIANRSVRDADDMADIEQIADELYGLPPEEFTAARTRY